MPAFYRIVEIAYVAKLPYMRPTWVMSLLIALLGGFAAFIATRAMKSDQKTSNQAVDGDSEKQPEAGASKKKGARAAQETDVSKKNPTNERQQWPWLGFLAGPGALQVTALLAGMLLASVSGEFALTAEIPPAGGEMIEWDADLTKGADVHEIDLRNATAISLVVRAEPADATANVLLADSGESAGTHRSLKIAGGRSTSWRGEPASAHLLVITKAEGAKGASKVRFVAFITKPPASHPR
jgi:hypothetical protein